MDSAFPESPAERTVAGFVNALEAGGSADLPDGILNLTTGEDAEPSHVQRMGRLLYVAWKSIPRRRFHNGGNERLVELARRGAALDGVSWHLRTALEHLALWVEADRYLTANGLASTRYHQLFSGDNHLMALRERVERLNPGLSTGYGVLMHEGMLASVRDRSQAMKLFRAAKAENSEFAAASSIDQFAATYYSEDVIEGSRGQIAERRQALADEFELLSEPRWGNDKSALLLFSCDPAYFAAHFPYWVSAIQYLGGRNMGLHFLLVGDRGESAGIVDKCADVTNSVVHLRGGDPAPALGRMSYSRVSMPEYVAERKTFCACARYLLARELSARFEGRVLILDVDMMVRADPAAFLRRLGSLSGARLPMAIGGGLASLIPARRHLAGLFPVPGGELGEEFMCDVEDYMYLGLSSPISWTLDQNAITYAVERLIARRGPGSVPLGLEEVGHPFDQWALITGLFVAEQRKMEAE